MIWIADVLRESWSLFLLMAPYLLLGFLVSGALYVYIPKDRMVRHLGKPGIASVMKAALFGVPLPLCSCGVIPAALSLRKQGASRGATLSFLISTPQTGIDSIMATYSLMGGFIALMRPLFSTLTAVTTGILANLLLEKEAPHPPGHAHDEGASRFHAPGRFRKIFSYGLRDHLGGVYRWLLVGLVLGAVVTVSLPTQQKIPQGEICQRHDFHSPDLPFKQVGLRTADLLAPNPSSAAAIAFRGFLVSHNELLCMLLMIVVGVPLYICATGSIPLAMAFMQAGLSPGAAFVFLMVGPATNVTTIVMALRYLGKKATLIYLACIVCVGLLSGYAINDLAPYHGALAVPAPSDHVHGSGLLASLLGWGSAAVLGGAILVAAWIDARMAWRARFGGPTTPKALTLPVNGMTCGHCKSSVESALRALPGVERAEANVSAGRVELVLAPSGPSLARIRDAIERAGYQVPGAAP